MKISLFNGQYFGIVIRNEVDTKEDNVFSTLCYLQLLLIDVFKHIY